MVPKGKNNSFVNFGLQGWLAAVCKCVVLCVGFLYFARKKKKQNKFLSICTAHPINGAPIQSIHFL
jgi:hypothetical protein